MRVIEIDLNGIFCKDGSIKLEEFVNVLYGGREPLVTLITNATLEDPTIEKIEKDECGKIVDVISLSSAISLCDKALDTYAKTAEMFPRIETLSAEDKARTIGIRAFLTKERKVRLSKANTEKSETDKTHPHKDRENLYSSGQMDSILTILEAVKEELSHIKQETERKCDITQKCIEDAIKIIKS